MLIDGMNASPEIKTDKTLRDFFYRRHDVDIRTGCVCVSTLNVMSR